MGGSAVQDNAFWQLFLRPAGSTRWELVTPPGTVDNGGLVLAGGGQALDTGFRPSQNLTYSPLIETSDGGQAWSSLNPLGAALASAPDALAVKPGGGQLLALLDGGPARRPHPALPPGARLASQRPWPPRRRQALRAAGPHRGRLHPLRHPGPRRHLHRARHRRHLHTRERNLAGGRAGPTRRPRRAGRHGRQADPDRAGHDGAAGGWYRTRCQPARRLVRRRRPLDPVPAAPAPRRHSHRLAARPRRRSLGQDPGH